MLRRVLHIEVGGAYGGSTKALKLYLRYADRAHFDNDVLFYFPTDGTNAFNPIANTSVLLAAAPSARWSSIDFTRSSQLLRRSQLIKDIVSMARAQPLIGKLAHLLRSERYDVVHVNNTFTYQPASILAAARVSIPVVAHVRNAVKFTAITKALARRVATFVAVSQSLADSFNGWPVRCIRDAIEVKPPLEEQVVQMRRVLGTERLIVGSVGRLHEQKGYEYLIHAAQIVSRTRPDVLFVVAGEGPLGQHLQILIDSLGLGGRFRLLGFRSDPEVLTTALDIYVCSSLWEGLPLTVLDAMALGVPVVGTTAGGIPEVITNCRTGWLVEPANVESLARAILEASAISAKARDKIVAAAKSAVAPFQDVEGLARQFEAIL